MAFGFGFNKTKALSSAERYIQQGKLHNAIAEYEKVMKSDPKDLTVRNTVGDLYARTGDTDKAIEHFRSVGDAYAAAGFTVKAIAMYKKLTKLKPSVECVLKLAELYSQQGLQNDSRAQYLHVAEQMLHAGQLEAAARVFQKVLEIDPENASMQSRLADVYVKLGRRDEARNLLQRAAEVLQARGNTEAVHEILRRLLEIDPGNSHALLMQGRAALDRGETAKAIAQLKQVPNIESNPQGARLLAQALLAEGNTDEAGAIARKLWSLHQDSSGLVASADALMKAGAYEEALQSYEQLGAALFTAHAPEVIDNLKACVGHVRGNAAALELLRQLFERSGDKSHLAEVAELQAQACVQAGDLEKARELYLQLAVLEPDNAMHAQNYHQIVERLGGKKSAKADLEESMPRVIEELERNSPALELDYPVELANELRRAITDADLFVSYNLPSKAAAPLLAALPKAPRDPRLNQRLAALHARLGHYREAAECCFQLAQTYREAGYEEYAGKCAGVAERYAERAGAAAATPAEAPVSRLEPAPHAAAAVEQAPAAESEQIDISNDWESSAAVAPAAAPEAGGTAQPQDPEVPGLVEEIRFYLQHGLWEEAGMAIEQCARQAPELAELAQFRAQLESRKTGKASPAVPPAETAAAPAPGAGKLSELVFDLEESMGAGFGTRAPMAAAAAASASAAPAGFPTAPPQAPPISPGLEMGGLAPAAAHDNDTGLAEIFSEFKEGLEQQPGTLTEGEDAETHYNLGVAFKEMGLLDEAIGELQKVCQAVERGQTFPHVMQAFTWLAQCFLEKGVPQASVRWYEKALKLPAIDSEARIALHYELASAYESAENKQAALNHFMEVYGANIEYRDVAERIKALKS
jgi:tetratricopeptide (TPR) repeat protein